MQNPAIPFIWSALAFAVGGYLIDADGTFLSIVGGAFIVFALLAANSLNQSLANLKSSLVHLSGLVLLFAGVLLTNKVFTDAPMSHAVLGCAAPMFVVSVIRFFNWSRG
jgi:hypothetical protein